MVDTKNEVNKLFDNILQENETAMSLIQAEIKIPKMLKRGSSQEGDRRDTSLMQHKSETFITANEWRSTVSVRK